MNVGALLGLTFGIIFGLVGWFFGNKEAKKQRSDDEVAKDIWQKTRSISWYVTLVVLYIFLFFVLFGVTISATKVLSILILVHLFSWAIVGVYLSSYYYNESKADRQIYKFLIAMFLILGIIFIFITFFYL